MLFQKKQTGYQGYQPKDNSTKKRIAIITSIAAILLIIIATIFGAGNRSQEKGAATNLKTYSNSSFSISIPKDFFLDEAGPKVKLSNEDSSESMTVEKYLEATPGNSPEKIINLTTKDLNGKTLDGITTEELKVGSNKALAITGYQDTTYYLYYGPNIWRLTFRSSVEGKPVLTYIKTILESFTPNISL